MDRIREKMQGQDNRMTSHPIYYVQEQDRLGSDIIRYQNVQPFFSLKGAEDFIHNNGHNLRKPRIYVASGCKNEEWKAIRAALVGPGKDD